MPENFKHIRNSINVVRPEFYSTVDLLISKYHCSKMQAVAGVIETGKLMFNRKYWKYHTEDTTCLDLDTAPHNKNIRRAGQAIHALSLGCLVEEIMESDDGAVLTYHTDGSRTQGVGSYTVQGITINGRYRSLPALPISSESRANLRSFTEKNCAFYFISSEWCANERHIQKNFLSNDRCSSPQFSG